MRSWIALVVGLGLVLTPIPGLVAADDGPSKWTKSAKLGEDEPEAFGGTVALDGDLLAVSHGVNRCPEAELVHVYERGAGGDWREVQEIEAPPNPHDDPNASFGKIRGETTRCFGAGLAIDEGSGVLAVGDPRLSVDGNQTHHEAEAGAVYIYERQADGSWQLAADVYGPVNGDWNDLPPRYEMNSHGPFFGYRVDVSGDTVVASLRDAVVDREPMRGALGILERQTDGEWIRTQWITSPNPHAKEGDHFGSDVTVAGGWIAASGLGETSHSGTHTGAVHLFAHQGGQIAHREMLSPAWLSTTEGQFPPNEGGLRDSFATCIEATDLVHETVWLPGAVRRQTACSTDSGAFGRSISLSADGTVLAVGDPLSSGMAGVRTPLGTSTGVAHVYELTASTGEWEPRSTLENPEPGRQDEFGGSVDVDESGRTILVGARQDRANGEPVQTYRSNTGLAWVFEDVNGDWECADRLSPDSEREGYAPHGFSFGRDVETSHGAAITGAHEGEGWVYEFRSDGPAFESVVERAKAPCEAADDLRWIGG